MFQVGIIKRLYYIYQYIYQWKNLNKKAMIYWKNENGEKLYKAIINIKN